MIELMAGQPERWHHPYGGDALNDDQVDHVLTLPQFSQIDASAFTDKISLRDIIRFDARIEKYQKGDVVTLLGDYGSSAFFILEGTVHVFIDKKTDPTEQFRKPPNIQSVYGALAQLWRNDKEPEVRCIDSNESEKQLQVRDTKSGETTRAYLSDIETVLNSAKTVSLGEKQMFGEISALARTPRTATIIAEAELVLVEMRWQGLREIRRRNREFRESLDLLYRERSLLNYFEVSPYFDHLDDDTRKLIANETKFETYGGFEWSGIFRKIQGKSYQVSPSKRKELIEAEPSIMHEGQSITGLIIVRQGFARISKELDEGHLTVDYVTTDEVFGLEELLEQHETGKQVVAKNTLRAIGYVDVLHIPLDLALTHIVPFLKDDCLKAKVSTLNDQDQNWAEHQAQMNFLVDNRVINGTASMFIDTDRCVNCDECVRACAINHNGNPRFIRHGLSHENWSVANACMHCVDPVCLIGCPTGAINRNAKTGNVIIEDSACIGCGTCAASCPYGNIRMVEARTPDGQFLRSAKTEKIVNKATKCDMCIGSPNGPACEQACPHGALKRINMRDRDTIPSLDKNRNRKKWMRRIGLSALVGVALVLFTLLEEYLGRSFVASQFLNGWALLTFIGLLTSLSARKKLSMLPLMKSSTWMQVHIYLGFLCLGIFGFHTEWRLPTGILDSMIWLGFLSTSFSGILGLFLSRHFPRRLRAGNNRSPERLLFERIEFLRIELEKEFHVASLKLIDKVAAKSYLNFYQTDLIPYFSGTKNFWFHVFNIRYPMRRMYQKLELINLYLNEDSYEDLDRIRKIIEKKDNLDFQYSLQKTLKSWLFFHIPLAFIMTVLPLVHVVVVYAFSKGAL